MDEETRAQRLAAWLNSPASTEPPEDLDPEVLGAVYALAPDRAPAPRVSIDDILGRVTEGPFAPTTGAVVEFPGNRAAVGSAPPLPPELEVAERRVPDEPARLVAHTGGRAREDVGAASPPVARRSPSRTWMMPTIGLALAAAAATLVIVPRMGALSGPDLGAIEAAREAAPLAAPGAAAPSAIAEMAPAPPPLPDAPSLDAASRAGEGAGGGGAAAAPVTQSGVKGDVAPMGALGQAQVDKEKREAPLDGARSSSATMALAPPPPPAPPPAPESPPATGYATADSLALGGMSPVEEARSAPATAATSAPAASTSSARPARRRDESYIPEAGPAMEREAADDSLKDAAFAAADEEDAQVVSEVAASKSASRTPQKKEAASAPAKAPAAAAGAASNVTTASARFAAAPFDYGVYSPPADVAPTFSAARSEESLGRWAQAADLWRTLTRDARPDVVQEAALRGAKALRNAGRATDALSLVDLGLRASGANTPVRSALYALRGDIASSLGRIAEAEAAWSEAAALNAAR